jgi:HK97 family phage portal protein
MSSLTSRVQKLFGLEKKASLATPDDFLFDLFGAPAGTTGIAITPRVAMTCTAVRCAVQAIAEPVGQLSVHVFKRDADGSKKRVPDHPVQRLLDEEPNEWTSASSFREQLTRDALLHGDGFAFINRVRGEPYELIRLFPERCLIRPDLNTGEPIYIVSETATETRQVSRSEVIHIPALSLNGYRGESLIRLASDAIGLALIMERHAARLFANGARPSGLISLKGNVTADALNKAKLAWVAAHGGDKSGGTAVLPADAAWQSLTLSSVDAQFLELRKLQIEEIARVFRVPPHMLYELGRATWGNSEQMGEEFLAFTLLPWIRKWEGEIRLKLFTREERKEGYFAEFQTDDLIRADIQARYEAYSKAIAARLLNPNEIRARENLPPYSGGDQFFNPNVQSARLT